MQEARSILSTCPNESCKLQKKKKPKPTPNSKISPLKICTCAKIKVSYPTCHSITRNQCFHNNHTTKGVGDVFYVCTWELQVHYNSRHIVTWLMNSKKSNHGCTWKENNVENLKCSNLCLRFRTMTKGMNKKLIKERELDKMKWRLMCNNHLKQNS